MYWSAYYTWGCPTRAMYVDHGTGPKRLVHGERPQKETAGNKGTILRVNARHDNHLRKLYESGVSWCLPVPSKPLDSEDS